jgi:hypothetical protein
MSTPNVIPSTSAPLIASSFILEQDCRGTNDAYILCRNANDDPASCETLAHAVLECTRRSFDRVAASPCRMLFERFWRCLDVNNQDFIYCRSEELSFEACTKQHLVYCGGELLLLLLGRSQKIMERKRSGRGTQAGWRTTRVG